ncbi:MAG: urease accessory protein UreE [Egibacteraceae bacterium]
MIVVERILGNRHADPALAAVCDELERRGGLERVWLSCQAAQRGRMRVTTDAGTELGIALRRGSVLRDGDVLRLDEHQIVAVAVQPVAELAIRPAPSLEARERFAVGVRLGHVLGNQHWSIRLEGDQVFVPVTVDHTVMETVMAAYGLDGLEREFVTVDPGEGTAGDATRGP